MPPRQPFANQRPQSRAVVRLSQDGCVARDEPPAPVAACDPLQPVELWKSGRYQPRPFDRVLDPRRRRKKDGPHTRRSRAAHGEIVMGCQLVAIEGVCLEPGAPRLTPTFGFPSASLTATCAPSLLVGRRLLVDLRRLVHDVIRKIFVVPRRGRQHSTRLDVGRVRHPRRRKVGCLFCDLGVGHPTFERISGGST